MVYGSKLLGHFATIMCVKNELLWLRQMDSAISLLGLVHTKHVHDKLHWYLLLVLPAVVRLRSTLRRKPELPCLCLRVSRYPHWLHFEFFMCHLSRHGFWSRVLWHLSRRGNRLQFDHLHLSVKLLELHFLLQRVLLCKHAVL